MKKILIGILFTLFFSATFGQTTKTDTLRVTYIQGYAKGIPPIRTRLIRIQDTLKFSDSSEQYRLPSTYETQGVINLVRDYGADTTGTIDISSRLLAACSTKRGVYLPKGNYFIDTGFILPDSSIIFGEGWATKIILGDSTQAFTVKNFARIENLSFIGSRFAGGTSAQIAITIDTSFGQLIVGCNFYKVAGAAIKTTQTNVVAYQGCQIENCYGDSCGIGIWFSNRGEYASVSNCTFTNGEYGIYMKGGNNSIVGGKITGNRYGIYINGNGDGNEAHSVASAVTLNHNTCAICIDSIRYGYKFDGCMIYFGDIRILNSDNVTFSGCDIDWQNDTLQVDSSENISFLGNTEYNVGSRTTLITASRVLHTMNDSGFLSVGSFTKTGMSVWPDSTNLGGDLRVDSAMYAGKIDLAARTETTINVTEGDYMILVDATAGNVTVNLPPAAANLRREITVMKVDASGNTVTIDADAGELINGATTLVISTQWVSQTAKCNATAWFTK